MSLTTSAFIIQRQLFPMLEEEIGKLSDKQKRFVEVLELSQIERFMSPFRWKFIGAKPQDRLPIAKAFIAKAVWNFPTTRTLLDYIENSPSLRRLCGWESACEIPSESTFSRAFADFADFHLPEKIHQDMVKETLRDTVIGHISRDATAIPAREKPAAKSAPVPTTPKKRGRPRKGQLVDPKPPKRLELQLNRSLAENLLDLPTRCDCGTKKNAQGFKDSWIGYKLHMDVIDGDIPVSAILTSASVHDSQVSIPLAQMSDQRLFSVCYDLMDAAYDAKEIHAFSRQLGHVPIIDPNPRGEEKIPFEPATARRFKQRSSVERVNSQLKDNLGAMFVRVRGATKVMCHLMFSVTACTAIQLLHRWSG
jgi:hypothetical protein